MTGYLMVECASRPVYHSGFVGLCGPPGQRHGIPKPAVQLVSDVCTYVFWAACTSLWGRTGGCGANAATVDEWPNKHGPEAVVFRPA